LFAHCCSPPLLSPPSLFFSFLPPSLLAHPCCLWYLILVLKCKRIKANIDRDRLVH
jgi:hypothetical protein